MLTWLHWMESEPSPSLPWRLGNMLTHFMWSVIVSHFSHLILLLHLAATCLAALLSKEQEEEHDDLGSDAARGNNDILNVWEVADRENEDLNVGRVAVEAAKSDDDSGKCNKAAMSACGHSGLLLLSLWRPRFQFSNQWELRLIGVSSGGCCSRQDSDPRHGRALAVGWQCKAMHSLLC